MMRGSLSLIVLAMVSTPKGSVQKGGGQAEGEQCYTPGVQSSNTTGRLLEDSGELEWDSFTIGIVLSAFNVGYMATQIIGGRLAEMFGFKKVYGLGVLLPSLLMFLQPAAANLHVWLFVSLRVLMGVFMGGTWPSMHVMTSRWVPATARSSFISQTYMGGMIGLVISLPLCGVVISSLGWQACFYMQGATGMAWFLLWWLVVHDCPQTHPRIGQQELEEIGQLGVERKKAPPVPWKAIATSIPFWATLFTDCGNTFGLVALSSQGPAYLKHMLGLNIKTNGLMSASPYLARYLGGVVLSRLADWLVRSGRLELVTSRRIFNTVSQFCPAVTMVLMGYSGCSATLALLLMVTGKLFNGAVSAGHIASAVDLAPNYSGTLFGLTNTLSGGGMGTLAPMLIGYLTRDNQTWTAWRTAFWVAGAGYSIPAVFYLFFSQAKPQEWNETHIEKEEKNGEEAEKMC